MRITRSLIFKLRLLGLVLCGLVLSPFSYSQDVVTGPFLIRDGIYYHQDTNEPVTGIVEEGGKLSGTYLFRKQTQQHLNPLAMPAVVTRQ